MPLTTYENEADWLAARAPTVSSTESSALFGMCPYLTAYELAVEKQGMHATAPRIGERLVWGKRLQDAIAQGIADDYKVMIESLGYAFAVHQTELRMGSSFDYRIVGVEAANADRNPLTDLYYEHGPGLLEIKNVDSLVFRDWPLPDAPDHIEIQVQHQLEVAELEWCALGVFIGGNRTELYLRRRDRVVGAAIKKRIHDFWQDLERGILPPPIMPQDADIVIKLHQYAEPGMVLNSQDDLALESLCEEYLSASEVASKATEAKRVLTAQILTHIGMSERALLGKFTISAGMVAATEVKAYTRGAYRNCRITRKKVRGKDQTQSAE